MTTMMMTTMTMQAMNRAVGRSYQSLARSGNGWRSTAASAVAATTTSTTGNPGNRSAPEHLLSQRQRLSWYSTTKSSRMAMDDLKTGTAAYMDLYPERSTDGGLRLGNIVPDFSAETTHGPWESFHEWKKGKWAILFSHPADFTPVCTTEIGRLAMKYDKLQELDCLVATLSVDPVKSHEEWLRDVVAHCENEIEVKFPIIGDADRSISTAYGMLDAGTSKDQALPLTIRAVFIINPENKLMLALNYPACVGRNMDEIVRCVEALQLSYEKSIATPANWPNNHADILLPDGTRSKDFKGSVFLLPTVSPEEAAERYPGHHTCDVPSKIPYLRLVKQEDVK